MKEFMAQNGGLLGMLALMALCLNVLLSGVSKALGVIKDKTATNVDNKAYEIINKITAILQKIVDWGSGNRQH